MLPDTFRELMDSFDRQKPMTIEFKKEISNMECYAEKGIRANISKITLSHDCVCVYFDYSDFDNYNKQFETSGYYDTQRNPVLTAREAGFYHEKESIYFDQDSKPNDFFVEVGDSNNSLYAAFSEKKLSGETYMAFLERMAKQALDIQE